MLWIYAWVMWSETKYLCCSLYPVGIYPQGLTAFIHSFVSPQIPSFLFLHSQVECVVPLHSALPFHPLLSLFLKERSPTTQGAHGALLNGSWHPVCSFVVLHFRACPGFRGANGTGRLEGQQRVCSNCKEGVYNYGSLGSIKGRRSFGVMAWVPSWTSDHMQAYFLHL